MESIRKSISFNVDRQEPGTALVASTKLEKGLRAMKTRKVMDIHDGGCHLEVIRIDDRKEANPYRVKLVKGGHRNQIIKYADWISVICFIREFYLDGMDTCPLFEIKEWIKERTV